MIIVTIFLVPRELQLQVSLKKKTTEESSCHFSFKFTHEGKSHLKDLAFKKKQVAGMPYLIYKNFIKILISLLDAKKKKKRYKMEKGKSGRKTRGPPKLSTHVGIMSMAPID